MPYPYEASKSTQLRTALIPALAKFHKLFVFSMRETKNAG